MGNSSSRFASCAESILTGTTKREQWLEERCTELARQNEQLRTKMLHGDVVEPFAGVTRQASTPYIERGGAPATTPAANYELKAESGLESSQHGGSALLSRLARQSSYVSSSTDLAALAVAAAAQEVADYQSSLVSVQIDNDIYDWKTEVTVRAPNRERLLADMNGALSGLGLLVLEARFTSEDTQAVYTFVVQDSTGHKVREKSRLEAIRQRLQQRFWGEQGLNGGVRRLVVDRYIPAMPPWEHVRLEPQAPPQGQEKVWLATVAAALRGGSSLGPLAPALAARLAADLLPEMRRMKLRPGAEVFNDSSEGVQGEWLLLVEGHALCTIDVHASPKEARRGSGASFAFNGRSSPFTDSSSRASEAVGGGGGGESRRMSSAANPNDAWMRPVRSGSAKNGSGSPLNAPPPPTPLASGGALVFGVSTREGEADESGRALPNGDAPNGAALPAKAGRAAPVPPGSVLWELFTPPHGAAATAPPLAPAHGAPAPPRAGNQWGVLIAGVGGLELRGVHLNTVRSRLAALRESLARQHSQILADTAVFAPLDTPRLLALCRRATLVEVPPRVVLLEEGRSHLLSSDTSETWQITDTTFGLVLDGELQMCLGLPLEHRIQKGLPALLPLARLGARSTFGEIGALTGTPLPKGVSMRSEGGATLLCWPRDPFLLGELQQLVGDSHDGTKRPSVLEGSWLARTPLALLVEQPHLACCLRPTSLSRVLAAHTHATPEVRPTDTMLVLEGEVTKNAHQDAAFEVHVLTEDNGGVPDKYAGGDALNGQLELVVAAHLPSRCTANGAVAGLSAGLSDLGLLVRDANLSLSSGVAHNAFHVILPAGDPRPAAVRAGEVQAKIQALQASTLRAGDAMPLLSEDGSSRIPRLSHPAAPEHAAPGAAPAPALANGAAHGAANGANAHGLHGGDGGANVALVDLRAFAALLASGESSLAVLWRRFLECNAPNLQLADGAPSTFEALSSYAAAGATEAAVGAPGTGGDVPGGMPGSWYATLCAFCLFRLRQQTNEPEVGVEVQDLELGPKLGEGGYGVVHLARHRVSGELFAVKSFTKAKIRRVEERTTYMRLERERKTLRLMQAHLRGGAQPYNLVRLVCSGHDPEWLRLVLPFYGGGDLSKLLDEQGKLPAEHVQFYAGCIILALTQLHSLCIAYRDLKPENILLTPQGWPVVTDFGLVAFLDEGHATSMVGTPEFMPPEVVTGTGHGTDADWWSLGVTLCELLTLTTPYCEPEAPSNHEKTYANIVHGRFSKAFEQKHFATLSKHTAAMISGLLKPDPQERLGGSRRGTESLRCHPFFWGLNWEALEARELTPPYAELCQNKAKAAKKLFEECERHGACMVLPHSMRPATPSMEGGNSAVNAAAAAMDRMFDFSAW